MVEKRVGYELQGRKFEGVIISDDSIKSPRPVIFMQPDWKGVGGETIKQAREVAGRDFIILMADMFGADYDGESRSRDELMASVKALRTNPAFTIACATKAFEALSGEAGKLGQADLTKKAMIGYCAGGGFALEHARAGADFAAVVVYHVTNPNPFAAATPCNIKGRVLALHGSADPVTPKAMMDAFADELATAKVDWQIMTFGGGLHSFCDPDVATTPATRYDAKLCRKSYMLTRDFLDESFAG